MSDPINFEIEDLITRYELHPEFCDVFVEGEDDQGFFQHFLDSNGRSGVSVYPISVVNIDAQNVIRRRLPHPSRRSEVITLALEIVERMGIIDSLTCIVDADAGHILPSGIACGVLLFTDYTSLELYAFDERVLQRVLSVVAPTLNRGAKELLVDFSSTLQELFLLRITNLVLGYGLKWIERFEKLCSLTGHQFVFDSQEYERRYLYDRVPAGKSAEFDRERSRIRGEFRHDVRYQIQGHDYVDILTWYLGRRREGRHLNATAIRQMLMLALDVNDLTGYSMFRRLLERTTRCAVN